MRTRITATIKITVMITTTAIIMTDHSIRSSPRKRGPRVASTESAALDPHLRGDERSSEPTLSHAALYRLMTWLSPAYPVGAFSYSSGLEWAVEAGDITDATSLRGWLAAMLTDGTGLNDGIFFAHAYRAAHAPPALRELAALAAAFMPSRERHLEATTQGAAFLAATRAAWPCAALDALMADWDGAVTYPVAAGVTCAGHDIPLAPALNAFLSAVTANWVSAAVRLIPLGQTDSQHVLNALEPVIAAAAQRALAASLDHLGSATIRADIASARHETQYTRLFRS
jgi:urease accessory protein